MPLVLAILLALGIGLRVALWLSLTPAGMTAYDTLVYVGMAEGELFEDPARTAGYSILLRALHPTATAIWCARHAVPVTGPLVGNAAVGAWLLIGRLRHPLPVFRARTPTSMNSSAP